MIYFTQIPDTLKYSPILKSTLSEIHSDIILYVSKHFSGRMSEKRRIIDFMNSMSYAVISGDSITIPIDVEKRINDFEVIPDSACRSTLQSMYISLKDVIWDIDITQTSNLDTDVVKNVESKQNESYGVKQQVNSNTHISNKHINDSWKDNKQKTDKSDLYIQPPTVPLFDSTSTVINEIIDGTQYVVYKSLPFIPTKQNEISATTDVDLMTSSDLRKLYPNTFIRTRSPVMYEKVDGLDYDNKLGVIFPIDGFKKEDIINNIIMYPHLYKLNKYDANGDVVNFYSTIEIDENLISISDIWDDLPESSVIPYNVEYIKEYVVRRYLLERDIKHINHRYKMFGELKPYLTLFMPIDDYISYGHTNIDGIAKSCVESRVGYKRSRNPIFRMVGKDV